MDVTTQDLDSVGAKAGHPGRVLWSGVSCHGL